MHRTQIYFDEALFDDIKIEANRIGISLSEYIRQILKKELSSKKTRTNSIDFSEFSGMWENRDIDQEKLRKEAWK